jgi:hypothetical protein
MKSCHGERVGGLIAGTRSSVSEKRLTPKVAASMAMTKPGCVKPIRTPDSAGPITLAADCAMPSKALASPRPSPSPIRAATSRIRHRTAGNPESEAQPACRPEARLPISPNDYRDAIYCGCSADEIRVQSQFQTARKESTKNTILLINESCTWTACGYALLSQ